MSNLIQLIKDKYLKVDIDNNKNLIINIKDNYVKKVEVGKYAIFELIIVMYL